MAREYAKAYLSLWADEDWRKLTVDAHALYMDILTHPGMSNAGIVDWRPGRLRPIAIDWTPERHEDAAALLQERGFIVVDTDTEEVLVRSFIRNDGVMKMPNMAISMMKAYALVASAHLRGVIVHELLRLHRDHPELKGWDKVEKLLKNPSIDPSVNPSPNPSVKGSGNPSGNPQPNPEPNPSVNPSPTTATSTNNSQQATNNSNAPVPARGGHSEPDPEEERTPALVHDDGTPTPAGIVRQWEKASGSPLTDSTRASMRLAVNQCLRAGHDPQTIAQGLADWANSKITATSQIPSFIDRAAVRPRLTPATHQHNADAYLELGRKMAAAQEGQ